VLQLKSQNFLSDDLQLAPVSAGVPDAPHIASGSAKQLPDSPAGKGHGQSPAACSLAARQHAVIVLPISPGTRGQQQQRAPSSAICRTASSGAGFDGGGKTVTTRCPDPSKAQTRPSSSWDSADRQQTAPAVARSGASGAAAPAPSRGQKEARQHQLKRSQRLFTQQPAGASRAAAQPQAANIRSADRLEIQQGGLSAA